MNKKNEQIALFKANQGGELIKDLKSPNNRAEMDNNNNIS